MHRGNCRRDQHSGVRASAEQSIPTLAACARASCPLSQHSSLCLCVYMCMRRPEVNTGYLPQPLFALFLRQTPSLNLSSLTKLGRLLSKLQQPTCLHLPSVCTTMLDFMKNVCVDPLPACMYVHNICVCLVPMEDVGSPETEVMDICELGHVGARNLA